eukprot:SAG25_NODE_16_length_24288_cov_31.926950_23_plen_113_part_00
MQNKNGFVSFMSNQACSQSISLLSTGIGTAVSQPHPCCHSISLLLLLLVSHSQLSAAACCLLLLVQVTCVWRARQNCDFFSSFAEFSRASRIQSLLKSENDSPLRSKKSWIH